MPTPSDGARHYVLLLIPSLLQDMKKLGLRKIASKSGLSEHEVSSFYFQTLSLLQGLPDSLDKTAPALWSALLERARLMTIIVGELSREELLKAKQQAIQNFLPQARKDVQAEHQKRLEEGDIDFHLAGLARDDASADKEEEICMEAIRLDREQCYGSLMQVTTEMLNIHQSRIVEDAKAHVHDRTLNSADDITSVDLIIHLGALLDSLLTLKGHPNMGDHQGMVDHDINHVVMGMGNMMYRVELGFSAPVAKQCSACLKPG